MSPCFFSLYAEYIIRSDRVYETQVGIKIVRRNINNLRHADDTILMAEREKELKSLLMTVKKEREKVGLKVNIQKTKIILLQRKLQNAWEGALLNSAPHYDRSPWCPYSTYNPSWLELTISGFHRSLFKHTSTKFFAPYQIPFLWMLLSNKYWKKLALIF